MTGTKSFYEDNEELVQLLKDVNAVLTTPDTSVIERYAGISELARFRSWQNVGVLTVGLFDQHPQVRKLAANTLRGDYNLGETSDLVLELLANNGEKLKDAIEAKDEQTFSYLINKMEQLRRKRSSLGSTKVDYGSQHLLIILRELGRWVRKLQGEAKNTEPHPLKYLLEKDDHRQSLKLIRKCLESTDVFCRRRAILLIGELDLDVGIGKRAFDLIVESIDQPDNRNDYLVTWNGIQAFTAIVRQNPNLRSDFFQKIHEIFEKRTYELDDAELSEKHRLHTQKNCVEALGELFHYEELDKLLRMKDSRGKLFDLMFASNIRTISGVKEAFINAFIRIYYQDSIGENKYLTLRQKKILNKIISWVNSSDRYVCQAVTKFFNELPSIHHGLVCQYLQQNIEHNYKRIDELLAQDYRQTQQKLVELLAKRRDLATVLGTLFARINQLSQNLSRKSFQKNEGEKAQQEKELLLSNGKEVATLLLNCCLHISDRNGQGLEVKNLKPAQGEVLWTLYELAASIPDAPSLTIEQITTLRYLEEDDSCRLVLALFRVRNSGELLSEQLQQLSQIVIGNDQELVRVCAEIEQQIKAKGRLCSLSEGAVKYIPKHLGKSHGIRARLASRFIPVLASMETEEATNLIKSLLESKYDTFKPLVMQLRAALCEYQCYKLRNQLVMMLLQDLKRRYKNRENLRLDYLNLFRAGKYQKLKIEEDKLQFPQEDKFTQQIVRGIRDIQKNFRKLELPVLFPQETEREQVDYCVVALESKSPEIVSTLLYKVEAQEMDEQIVKAYLRRFKEFEEKDTWVFLSRALTDKEIVQIILSRRKPNAPITEVNHFIVGRVERIADDDSGVYVDIGLHQYKSVFVSKSQMISEQDEAGINWQQYVRELLGSILKFRINIKIDTNTHQIDQLELNCREFWIDPLENPETDITVRGRFVGDSIDDNIPSAIFKVEGINKTLKVLLPELSWRSDKKWVDTWHLELRKREKEEFEITYNKTTKQWSLRENKPKDEDFLQLLYENSQNQNSFELVYVKKIKQGYVFEIKPGKLCYVPAERLLEIDSQGDEHEYNFLLSKSDIKPGSRVKAAFTEDQSISSKPEVILKVLQVFPAMEDMLTEGMRIFGIFQELEYLDKNVPLNPEKDGIQKPKIKKRGRLIPSPDEQPPGHNISEYSIEIEELPSLIKSGDEVSGKIIKVYKYEKKISLKYVEAIDTLLEGQSYQCNVIYTPKPEDSRLLLRHANIFGILYERNITYGHIPILSNYRQGSNLIARVMETKEAKPRKETVQVKEQVLAQLGLESEDSNGGKVITNNQGIVTFESKDYKPVKLALQDLKFEGDGKNIPIHEGDRIHFSKVSLNKLEMIVESIRTIFSVRRGTNEKWSNWQDVLKIDNPCKCIYVDFQKQNYLLEFHPEDAQPLFLALPKNCAEGIAQIEALHIGDYLTLRRSSDEIVDLEKFEPGPLHFAAAPRTFSPREISWIKHQPLTNNQDKIIIFGKIIDTNYQHGIRIELQHLHLDSGDIPLSRGIQAFYRFEDIEEQQRFRSGCFRESNSIEVILAQPPEIRQDKLWLTLKSSSYIQKTKVNLDVELLREKLKKIRLKWLESNNKNKKYTVKGTIGKYVEKEGAFQVILDELSDYYQDNYCWLPAEHVSASLVHSYNSLEDFGDERRKTFTIIDVYPDYDQPELEVSLTENYPTISLEEARKEFEWSVGTILKLATFLGVFTKTEGANSEESQAQVTKKITEVVSIEIKPGVIVDTLVEKFFVEGLEYKSGGEGFGLQRGDQITLRLNQNKNETHCTLDVVKFVRAEFNLLSDQRKVVYGEIKGRPQPGEKVKLKLQGYSKVQCFLTPDFSQDVNKLLKRKRILFRVTDFPQHNQIDTNSIPGNELYFKPIEKQDLKDGDSLRVTYKDLLGKPPRLRMVFGENHEGYISKFDITYQLGFELSQFNAELGDEYDAVVKQDVAETSDVKLSLKKPLKEPPSLGLSYFLNQDSEKTIKAVIIQNVEYKNYLDIEVKPNVCVRVPYARFWELKRRKDDFKPGNVLLFKVIFNKRYSQVNLQLEDIEKNNLLGTYLEREMLVRAQLNYKAHLLQEGKFLWRFLLPDYGNIEAKLETKDDFRQDIDYEMRLKILSIPPDPTRPIVLGERSQEDEQQRLHVDSQISGDRIKMLGGDGKAVYLQSYYATYRINNKITYLRKQLQPGQVVVATKISINGRQQFSLRYDLKNEKRYNKPLPLTYLRQFLQPEQKYSDNLELTYVCAEAEGEEQIFELEPGRLVAIPASSLYFYGYSLHKNQFKRFFPGDIFTVKLEIPSAEELDRFQVTILKIELCILHDLHTNQIIEAEVKEVIPEASGIVIKAKYLELEHFVNNLLPENSIYDYKIGQSIWLMVDSVNHEEQRIWLKQIANSLSLDEVLDKVQFPVFVYGKIEKILPISVDLTLEVPKKEDIFSVELSHLSWSQQTEPKTINDILSPTQEGMWVYIYKSSSGIYVRQKNIRKRTLKILSSQIQNNPDIVVQAQVLKCNISDQGAVKSVLLNVDGIQTLIAHKDLVQGAQSKPCVKSGMWVAVCLKHAEYDTTGDENKKRLSVSAPKISELDTFPPHKTFTAKVCYTLEHGLVFIYKQTLGYVSNEELTWSRNAKAEEMFTSGDVIQVYKLSNHTFSLKNSLQIDKIEIGQEVEAEIHQRTKDGLYLKLKDTNIFVRLPLSQLGSEQLEEQIVLRLEEINNRQQIADFRWIGETIDTISFVSKVTAKSINKMLDCYYMTAFKRLVSQWQEIINSFEKLDENDNAKHSLVTYLKKCDIPCTYINIRKLIQRLVNKPYTQKLWTQLVDCEPNNDVIYILCQVARKCTGQKLLATHPNPETETLSHYAVGIAAIKQEDSNITPIQALEHLLTAYRLNKTLDIQIALLIIYDKLGYFQLRRAILKQIITHLSQNLNWLLKLPLPLEIDESCYPRFKKDVPDFNDSLAELAKSIKEIRDDYLYAGKLDEAEQHLKDKWIKIRVRGINMPELALNLAICRILKNDWHGTLSYLEQAAQTLSKAENRDRFGLAHQAYYQLAMYVNYQLGRFPQLQNLIEKGFQQNVGRWLETLLAYVFKASENHHLSSYLIQQRKQSPSVLKKNVNGLEHILLDLYWQDTEQNATTKLEGMQHLRGILFQDERISSWTQPILNIRLFPSQAQSALRFDDKISYGKQYDVPDYAFQQYYEKPIQVKLAKKETVADLSVITLSLNKLYDTQNILLRRQDAELSAWFYQELLLINEFNYYLEENSQDNQSEVFDSLRQSRLELEEIVRKLQGTPPVVPNRDEYSGEMLLQLMERWIKSPYNRELVGQKLINVLKDNPALRNVCWSREDLRTQMWQAIDRSLDYGSVVELMPTYLTHEALENQEDNPIMQALIALEKHHLFPSQNAMLSEFIQDIPLFGKGDGKIDELAQQLLPVLYKLDNNCFELVKKLQLLQRGFRRLKKDV